MDNALRATMLFPQPKELPDLWTTALDEILAVGIRPDGELDDLVGPVAATVPLDEAIDRFFDLQLPSGAVLSWEVEE